MFRPAFVAIVRLQSSSVKNLYNMLKGRLMMRSQSSEKLQSTLINLVYIVWSTVCREQTRAALYTQYFILCTLDLLG
jgi:hypothetical protein